MTRASGPAWAAGGVVGVVVLGAVLAYNPWLAAGALLGGVLVAVTLAWPLAVVGLMLAIGPLDLSFVTGGFKDLLPQLGGLDMNGIRLVGISAGLLAVVAVDRGILRSLLGRRARWYVVFLLVAGATLAYSFHPLGGLRLLTKLAWPLLIYLVVAAPGRTPEEVHRLGDWALIGATAVVLINPLFVLAGGYEVTFGGWTRIQGLGVHENPFSFYLVVILLYCVARYTSRGQTRYLLLGVACVGWMALTLTRIAFGGAVVGLGGMAVYAALARGDYRALIGAGVLGVALVALLLDVVLVRTFGYVPSLDTLLTLSRRPVELFESMNWQGRESFWPALFQTWMSSPWVGLGLGSSGYIMTTQFPPEAGLVPHNEYLRLGVDTGFLGVGLFFLATFAWLRAGVRAGRSDAPRVQEFALPLVGGMLAWAVISVTDNAFDYYAPFTQYIGFFLAGAVVVAREGEAEEAAPDADEPARAAAPDTAPPPAAVA